MDLRPYQVEQVASVLSALETDRATLFVSPTGTGKTVTFAHLADAFAKRGQRTLVLAHREELLQQAVSKIQAWTGLECGLERATSRAHRSRLSLYGFAQPVVVASIQSISQPKRLAEFAPDEFGLVVVDEAHHAPALSYVSVLRYFGCDRDPLGGDVPAARIVGCTATPDRADKLALGRIFESVAHDYEIRQAIADGYLVPIRQHAVHVEDLDLSHVRTTAGDLNEGDLARVVNEEKPLQAMADAIWQLAGDRPTLVFGVTVEHAQLLTDQLNRRALRDEAPARRAKWLSGESGRMERAAVLEEFHRGEFQFLCGCALFLEGFDEPRISCVAMCRPTKSRALYAQAVGRGTRLYPEGGKADLLILDFKGNAGRHALVNAVDILDGNMSPAVRKEAEKLAEERPGVTVEDLVHLAEEKVAEEEERLERERQRRRHIAAALVQTVEVDPFTLRRVNGANGYGAEITDKQRAMIRRLGLPRWKKHWGPFPDKRAASVLIDALMMRRGTRRTG